jgi:hypothetical protein
VIYLIRKAIEDFEKQHGKIDMPWIILSNYMQKGPGAEAPGFRLSDEI